jgi:N-acetylmuramoyl-L-alanine amidase
VIKLLLALLLALPSYVWAAAGGRVQVLIDPGHGGSDPGVQAEGLREADYALALAKDVSAALKARGLSSQLTRESDQGLSLSARVLLANSLKPVAMISLHINSSHSQGATGARLFVPAEGPVDDPVAPLWPQAARLRAKESKALGTALARALGVKAPRPVQSLKMGLFRGLAVPACVIECGFVGEPGALAAFKDASQRQALAERIAAALARFVRGEATDAP